MSDIEKLRLNTIAGEISYTDGVQEHVNRFAAKILKRFLAGGQILELGPAEGVMTAELLKFDLDLTVVEGSSTLSRALEDKFPKLNVINALFEDFDPKEQYGTIVLSHVLEHVENPIDILAKVGKWVAPNGIIFAAVPNALSLHRRAGVLMRLIDEEDTLNDQDISIGYRRVYTPELLHAHFRQANLNVAFFGGYWLKPLANRQIEGVWTEDMIDAFLRLGERFPDIAGEIYVVASEGQRK